MISRTESHLDFYCFDQLKVETLKVSSHVLKKNPLGDSCERINPLLLPKGEAPKKGFPVVIMLSGLTSNGPKNFAEKVFEENRVQKIARLVSEKKAPRAIYLFIDAMTFWGGSQFINSAGSGNYEDYLMKEVVPALCEHYPANKEPKNWCVMGASSGGYGAFHLASRYPDVFGNLAAIAPDSDFERSLLPEFYTAAGVLNDIGIEGVRKELAEGRLFRRKLGHTLLNVVAMAHCYSDKKKPKEKDLPMDLKTGEVKKYVWKKWLTKDPIYFLPQRKENLKKIKKIILEVGVFDQFHLAFGARRIRDLLKKNKVRLEYQEFRGNHFDTASREEGVWARLEKSWKTH